MAKLLGFNPDVYEEFGLVFGFDSPIFFFFKYWTGPEKCEPGSGLVPGPDSSELTETSGFLHSGAEVLNKTGSELVPIRFPRNLKPCSKQQHDKILRARFPKFYFFLFRTSHKPSYGHASFLFCLGFRKVY